MKTKLIIFLAIFFLAAKCHKEEIEQTDENGVVISKAFLWEKTLYGGGASITNSSFKDPIIFNGNIGIPTIGDGKRYFTMINPETSETIWQWSDIFNPETEEIDISYYHQYNNLLTYQYGGRSYCIDLNNGSTHWKIQREQSFDGRISGLDNVYFTFGNAETLYSEYDEWVCYKGNMETGEIEEFLVPDFTINIIAPGNRIGNVTNVLPYMYNGVQYLTVIWQEPFATYDWQSYLGLYNYETNEWVYKKKIMNEPNINGVLLAPPVIYNKRIYADIGKEIVCHDLATGEQLWSRQFTQDFMFSGFIIVEDKLIGSNENETLYCLNPDNGNIIWQTEGSGTSSRLSYLNGIVYFAGGADGKLHAVDISNGKTVWLLEGKYLDDSYFKTNAIYVFPAEGNKAAKVIALTHQHAYCFEAYQ
jgi:outer membrane protein assembly factor BamB